MRLEYKENNDLLIGQIVRSKAGRDKGLCFVVYDTVDANYVLLVDGDLRKIANPKKKKNKHLQPFNTVIEEFEQLKEQIDFNDAFVRKQLKKHLGGDKNYVK